jgi:predicted nucleic acid-binding protein
VAHGSTNLLQKSLDEQQLLMNPFVLAELLSSPKLPPRIEKYLLDIPRIEIDRDFFVRAGHLRKNLYKKGKGVSIADIYIAQSCMDAEIPLLSIDQDLLMISELSGLKLVRL